MIDELFVLFLEHVLLREREREREREELKLKKT
jgi:hypothetical protein